MMAEKKRQCGTCRFFSEKEASGHGKCTHPKRAGTDAELLLLRPSELACRTRWGDSLWQDPEDETDPMEPRSPQQPTLPEPIAAQLQFDDEVTSVSIAGSKSSRSSFEDDVVDSGATATGMASWNDPIQEERLDLLRRGSHDAVAGARKRHLEKQARQRDLIPFADDDDATKAESTPEPTQKPEPTAPLINSTASYPPDDFVEEERTATEEDTPPDDEMVDKGVMPEPTRSPRLRHLLKESNNPKKNEAMRLSVPSEMRVTSHNPEQREQWNSVPIVNPGFELPLNTPARPSGFKPNKVAASAAPVSNSSYQPRPVSQARELLSEDRLRQERAQRQMVAPLDDAKPEIQEPEPKPLVTDRPRLTEAPARTAAPLERIKSSPLRGYHKATRKPAQQIEPEPGRAQPTAERRQGASRPTPQQVAQQPAPQRKLEAPPQQRSPRQSTQLRVRDNDEPTQARSAQHPGNDSPTRNQNESREHVQPRPRNERTERPQEHGRVSRDDWFEQESRKASVSIQPANEPFVREEIEIAKHLNPSCGTCASFQPGGVEGRGSCTNGFAGPIQRVVYEQDHACKRTFGSFWLPADEEIWLEELRTDYPPTPRVDAMLARKRRKANPVLPDLEELTS